MAEPDHIKRLLKGVEVWNECRAKDTLFTPDLSGEDLHERLATEWQHDGPDLISLAGIDLTGANLRGSGLDQLDLKRANLRSTELEGASFKESDLSHADFFDANLAGADLSNTRSLAGTRFAYSDRSPICEEWKKNPLSSNLYPDTESPRALPNTPDRIRSVGDFLNLIRRIKKHHETYHEEIFLYFRGESKRGRALIPFVMRQDEFRGNEARLLRELISRRPEEFSRETSALSQWVLAQHHGLPTRFLDVTRNPLVALFNACKNDSQKSGRLYIFAVPESLVKPFSSDTVSIIANMANLSTCEQDVLLGRKGGGEDEYAIAKLRLYQGIKAEKPYFEERMEVTDLYKVFVIEPKQFSARIRAQSAAFLASAYHQRFERCEVRSENCQIPIYADYKLEVMVDKKCSIMAELGVLNIGDESLSPGLDASANAVMKQFRRQQQIKKDEIDPDKCEVIPFLEHEKIVLTTEVVGEDKTELKPGDVGTIIRVHPSGEAFEVEFKTLDGDTLTFATVLPSEARRASGTDMIHARSVEIIV